MRKSFLLLTLLLSVSTFAQLFKSENGAGFIDLDKNLAELNLKNANGDELTFSGEITELDLLHIGYTKLGRGYLSYDRCYLLKNAKGENDLVLDLDCTDIAISKTNEEIKLSRYYIINAGKKRDKVYQDIITKKRLNPKYASEYSLHETFINNSILEKKDTFLLDCGLNELKGTYKVTITNYGGYRPISDSEGILYITDNGISLEGDLLNDTVRNVYDLNNHIIMDGAKFGQFSVQCLAPSIYTYGAVVINESVTVGSISRRSKSGVANQTISFHINEKI